MEEKKIPIKVIIDDGVVAVSCAGGEYICNKIDNAWLWVLGAIAFPNESELKIVDRRTRLEDHQVNMTTK